MNFARYAFGLAVCGMLLASCSSEEPAPPPKKEKVVKEKKAKPAPVEEEDPVLQPMTATPEPAAPAGNSAVGQQESGTYVVQIGIQPSRKAANALIEKLAAAGITAYAAEVEDPGELEGTYYRVRAGYFATIRDAQTFGKEVVEPAGFPWWVDNKANDKVGNPSGDDSYESTTYASPSSYSSYSEPVKTYEPEPEPEPAPAPEPPPPAPAPEPEPEPAPPAPEPEPVAAPEPPPAEEPPPALPEEAAPGSLPPMEDVEGPIAEEPSVPAPAAPELDDDDSWD